MTHSEYFLNHDMVDGVDGVDGVDSVDDVDGVDGVDLEAEALPNALPDDHFDVNNKWSNYCWIGRNVREIITASETPEMVILASDDDVEYERRGYTVHKALLCHFSAHYHAALDSGLAGTTTTTTTTTSNRRTLATGASSVVLRAAVAWLYTGDFDLPDTESEYAFHLHLYHFAAQTQILALRRAVLNSLQAFFTSDIDDNYIIASNRIVAKAYELLSPYSPFIAWLQQTYAFHHYNVYLDGDGGSTAKGAEGILPIEFCRAVAAIKLGVGRAIQRGGLEPCGCCGNMCRFHEHESSAECVATCGR